MTEYTNQGSKDTRSGFGAGLLELGQTNPNVVALCADLTGSLKMGDFKDEFPDRFYQVGIAEANMMGIAAGLTIGGKIPYTGTFANFSTGRVYEQIRQSIAYSGKNVKICASHSGLTLGEDGATHQILEDIGLMKMLPGQLGEMAGEIDENEVLHAEAIIQSMTPAERRTPKLLNGSRRLRIAKGSGVTVTEVNQLVMRFEQAAKMMKTVAKGGVPQVPGMGPIPGGSYGGGKRAAQAKKKKGSRSGNPAKRAAEEAARASGGAPATSGGSGFGLGAQGAPGGPSPEELESLQKFLGR